MATKTGTPARIHLLGSGRTEEALASGAITPGHLLELTSTSAVKVHATAGGWAEKAFACEDALQGKTIADAYADAARVTYVLASPGDVVYAWLYVGESVAVGAFLTSNGDGTLKAATSTDTRVAVALEAVDLNDTGDVTTRIRVRVL